MAAGDARTLSGLRQQALAEARLLEDLLTQKLDGAHDFTAARMEVRELTFLVKLADDLNAMLATLDE